MAIGDQLRARRGNEYGAVTASSAQSMRLARDIPLLRYSNQVNGAEWPWW